MWRSGTNPLSEVCMLCGIWLLSVLPIAGAADPLPKTIDFNRDIRPILSDNCFECHGPDKTKRKADLRLDTKQSTFAVRDGSAAVVPGDPGHSALYQRITSADADEHMPPTDSGRKLTPRQIALVRLWIAQGAGWQKHWSFIPPQRPALPSVAGKSWPRNAIDYFVLSRLERKGLAPSPETSRETLIRRVTFDLTGLPPTPAEVDLFLKDRSPNAYEKVVDRLLGSPRYGERMATLWLDAARYADTNGYQTDGERSMWRWRDWVIAAYNRNMPFDQFTIEQIAGDLLPNPSLDQLIATGFNRNHRGNAEGGVISAEFAVEYVVDRVNTTSTVWLGLTLGCARCHEHKYDPFSQTEFYRLFAYFNNVPERGKAVKYGNSPPTIKAPTEDQRHQLADLERRLATAKRNFHRFAPQIVAAQTAWESGRHSSTRIPKQPFDWSVTDGLTARFSLDGDTANDAPALVAARQAVEAKPGQSAVVAPPGNNPKRPASTPAVFHDGKPVYTTGRLGKAVSFDGGRYLDAGDIGNFGYLDKLSLAAWVFPRGTRGGTILSRMLDTAESLGYSIVLNEGRIHANLVNRWLDDAIRVETVDRLPPDQWHHVMMTYDGSREARGVHIYVDGKPWRFKILVDELNQSFESEAPLRIGSDGGADNRFHGRIDDVRIYQTCLKPAEARLVATSETISEILAIPADRRTRRQADKLRAYFLERIAPRPIRQARQRLRALQKRKEQLIGSFPTTMVMQEMPTPRTTHLLIRGRYDKPDKVVTPGVPAAFSPLPRGVPNNRLGFARWLVDRRNPLTARVVVNRYWQAFFGTGLVKTTEDFGSQGERPSHPKLLDWLASEFMRTGWNIKAIQKTIVTSAVYRQSSRLAPALLRKDPANRLLARGPRFRLTAEMLRDQALAVSGLLAERLGGPSVKPYQPADLWKDVSGKVYQQDHGANLYRRSLYTYFKRTVAPPTMTAFDAAGREMCIVRRSRTDTPLQALALMNEVSFVEAARVLAERVLTEGGSTPDERIVRVFRLATSRRPRPAELRILRAGFGRQLQHYRSNRAAAKKLIREGESKPNPRLDAGELAAYTTVAGLILNLDEVVTKE